VLELEQNDGGNTDGRFLQGPESTPEQGLSPPQRKALSDGGATDLTYILGFFLVLGLGALLIVAAWR
jgi:hypothetical protein